MEEVADPNPEADARRTQWTPEKVSLLKQYVEGDKAPKWIAEQFGTSVGAIYAAINKAGLTNRKLRPRLAWADISAWLLQEVQALNYRPSPRWCFYRVMDRFGLGKEEYKRFSYNLAAWRKDSKGGWRPDTLTDSIRRSIYRGHGYMTWETWAAAMVKGSAPSGVWRDPELPFYVEAWFESEAMVGQFEEYLGKPYRITLRPFRGDASIPMKWDAAKTIEAMVEKGGATVTILYFGDADRKGSQIPQSAYEDVHNWAMANFDFHIGGLTRDQAEELGLPENPERPGEWQWEALSDDQAREIILNNLAEHVDVDALREAIERADERTERWRREARQRLGLPEDEGGGEVG